MVCYESLLRISVTGKMRSNLRGSATTMIRHPANHPAYISAILFDDVVYDVVHLF